MTESQQPAATESQPKPEKKGDTFKTLFYAVVLALIIRSLVFEPFHIPSGSMKDTLLIGDFIFVSKASYGYSRYSFPLGLPVFEGRVMDGDKPKRGDIIVFRLPSNPRVDYIKRLIGFPGDTIQMKDGTLYINGEMISKVRVDDYVEYGSEGRRVRHVPKYKETLPNGVEYYVLDAMSNGEVDTTMEYEVPEGHYFFMGDNRDHSIDSRYDQVGFVPEENLIGRAQMVVFSVERDESLLHFWKWGETIRSGRYFIDLTNPETAM